MLLKMSKINMRRLHSTSKTFSSLFSVDGGRSAKLYENALAHFGLSGIVNFESVIKNCERLRIRFGRHICDQGLEESCIFDVPAQGDCWIIALFAPLLGFIVTDNDDLGIVKQVREVLSESVLEDVEKFKGIFENGREGAIDWAAKVKRNHSWGGDTEFEIFARITGIAIHVINRQFPEVQGTTHFLPRCPDGVPEEIYWGASIVLEYGFGHYRAVIPRRCVF